MWFVVCTLRFFIVVVASVAAVVVAVFFLTSFSFGIVQIKSGRNLFVHLLFGCTHWFMNLFLFSVLFDLFESLLICDIPCIVCGRLECLLHRLNISFTWFVLRSNVQNNQRDKERVHVFFKSMSDLELSSSRPLFTAIYLLSRCFALFIASNIYIHWCRWY